MSMLRRSKIAEIKLGKKFIASVQIVGSKLKVLSKGNDLSQDELTFIDMLPTIYSNILMLDYIDPNSYVESIVRDIETIMSDKQQ